MGFLVVKHSFGPKLYFLDTGLVCYLTGIKDEDHLLKGPLSDSPKGAIRFGIPTHVAGYLFPDLYPVRNLKE